MFFGWACLAVLLLIAHATAALVSGGLLAGAVDVFGFPVADKFYFYGLSQLMLALLTLSFAISALRRENQVTHVYAYARICICTYMRMRSA